MRSLPMHPTSSAHPLARWLVLCASVSTAYVLACAGFSCRYYLAYGQWPWNDAHPTAQKIDSFWVLRSAVLYLFVAQVVTVPLCLSLFLAVRVKHRLVALYAVAAVGAAVVTSYSKFINWFFED